jgi:diguanylate cyclase (GGDEF)-like protein
LKSFAADLKDTCREYDYVARMGGDEFVLIIPGMQPEDVGERASRLNQLAIRAGRRICGKDVISLSVGTSFCPKDGFDVECLLAEADRKMYTMKQVHHALADQARAASVQEAHAGALR